MLSINWIKSCFDHFENLQEKDDEKFLINILSTFDAAELIRYQIERGKKRTNEKKIEENHFNNATKSIMSLKEKNIYILCSKAKKTTQKQQKFIYILDIFLLNTNINIIKIISWKKNWLTNKDI